ncbi:MAG TPA: cytochrome c peroxidase [Polyangia bacterium]|nr:cytochrome c peroxidase [Polyangia bacterium]
MEHRIGMVGLAAAALVAVTSGCDGEAIDQARSDVEVAPVAAAVARHPRSVRRPAPSNDAQPDRVEAFLGALIFNDVNLSASGTEACASCHEAERAFTGNNDPRHPLFPVSVGAYPNLLGTRNAPTAMYMAFSPTFGFVEDEDGLTPTGGQFWDGRADSLAEQAKAPFVNPREMALPDHASVITRVRRAPYAPLFRSVYGHRALDDVESAYDHLADAIQAFERTSGFAPFSSKFDAYLRGRARLTRAEAHGFALFKDPEKGNCIACHAGDPSSRDPRDWLFTDFTYDNLGIPRNGEIADNADPSYFDLGLCARADIAAKVPAGVADPAQFIASLCGAFKVPTLRNIARTAPYGHNGYFKRLRDMIEFYVTRDTNPERWYPAGDDGRVQKFNDLPPEYRGNVNTEEVPYDRHPGESPRLDEREIDDLLQFLATLSDGYDDRR